MRAKTILSLLFLISLGVAVVVILRALPHRAGATSRAATAVAAQVQVLVARAPLAIGTLLRDRDVAWRPVVGQPNSDEIIRPALNLRQTKPELDTQARASVYGAALAMALPAGAPIRHSIIVKPGAREFLRLVLSPGERAIAIPVATGGASTGLLSPGDRVDVILTQVFRGDKAVLARSSVSETILQNLRVLAINTPDAKLAGHFGPIVTLEVTPSEAEAINVATELGKLSLTLRPSGTSTLASANLPARPAAIKAAWAGDVSPVLGNVRPPQRAVADPPPIQVIRGTHAEAVKPQ